MVMFVSCRNDPPPPVGVVGVRNGPKRANLRSGKSLFLSARGFLIISANSSSVKSLPWQDFPKTSLNKVTQNFISALPYPGNFMPYERQRVPLRGRKWRFLGGQAPIPLRTRT